MAVPKYISITIVGIIVAGIAGPLVGQFILSRAYRIQPAVHSLIGSDSSQLASRVTYDKDAQIYQFNKDGLKQAKSSDSSVDQGLGKPTDNHMYAADFNTKASLGVKVYDTANNLSMGLTPMQKSYDAHQELNHFVYPSTESEAQLIYSLKGNGVKEDLVLKAFKSARFQFDYKLDLPTGLEARLTPEGGIGVYSANTALYGNITYASDDDRARVDAARKNSAKSQLVFYIPAPVINEANGKSSAARAIFKLSGSTLSVIATKLDKASYPLSIDPSIVVTSNNDFLAGDGENISYDATNNQITRSPLAGGSTGAWANQTNLNTARSLNTAVVSGGNIYTFGGHSASAALSSVEYATINATTGALSAWTTITGLSKGRVGVTTAASGGYIYAIGGTDNGTTAYADIEYAKVSPTGGLSANTCGTGVVWCAFSQALPSPRAGSTAAIMNGYLYVMGGCNSYTSGSGEIGNCATFDATTSYIKIGQDGNANSGSWSTGTSFTTARYYHAGASYNNALYVIGGCSATSSAGACTSSLADVQMSKVDTTTGAMTTWQTTTSLPAARIRAAAVVSNGNLFVMGADTTSVISASIYATSLIGGWSSLNSMTNALRSYAAVAHNGRIYTIGGFIGVSTGITNNTFSATLDPAGANTNVASSANFDTTGREGACAVAAYGYFYLIGGRNGSTYYDTARRAPINADGTLGTWAASSGTMPVAKAFMGCAVSANGDLVYALGGYGPCGFLNAVDYCASWAVGQYTAGGNIIWTASTFGSDLPSARRSFAALFRNNIIYVIGGTESGGVISTVNYAVLTSNGGIHSNNPCGANWCSAGSLPNARTEIGGVSFGNYLYITGGHNTSTYYRTTLYAGLSAGGGFLTSICGTTWCTGPSLNVDRAQFSLVPSGGYLYAVGGCNTAAGCTNELASIEYAPVLGPGSIGSWTTSTHSLATARSSPTVATYAGSLFVVGGNENGTIGKDVEISRVSSGGNSGIANATIPAGATLTTARLAATSVVSNGYVYLIGGCTAFNTLSGVCTAPVSTIEYAKLLPNGDFVQDLCTVGTVWCSTTSLVNATNYIRAFVNAGYLYVVGGSTATSSATADVSSIEINSNGTLGAAWNAVSNPSDLNIGRTEFALTTSSNYVYVVRGYDSSGAVISDLEYAQIQPNGALGAWTTKAFSGGGGTHDLVAWIANGFFYLAGGGRSASVLGATIDPSTGAVGTITQLNSIDTYPNLPTLHYANGFAYYIGPFSILPVTMLSGGTAEQVVQNAAVGFTASHDGASSIYFNGYLYMFGGCTTFSASDVCSAIHTTVERVATQAATRTSRYSQTFDLGSASSLTKFVGNGALEDSFGSSVSVSTTITDTAGGQSTSSAAPVTLGGIAPLSGYSRYVTLNLTINDTSTGFPDPGQTSISDLNMYFHAGTPGRLLRGKSFTNEILRPLDTDGP